MGLGRFLPHSSRWRLALSGAVGMSLIAAMSGAAAIGDDNGSSTARFARIDPSLFDSSSQHLTFVPASLSNQPVDVVLELSGAPVAVQDAQAKSSGRKLSVPIGVFALVFWRMRSGRPSTACETGAVG